MKVLMGRGLIEVAIENCIITFSVTALYNVMLGKYNQNQIPVIL